MNTSQAPHHERPGVTFSYGHALQALKKGQAVTRSSWSAAFVSISPGHPQVPANAIWSPSNRKLAEALPGQAIAVSASFSLAHTAVGIIHMGWLPSADDLLAEDWVVLQ